MYVASVVPSPARLVAEMRRVCRPGGELFIVNHFRNTHPFIGRVERLLAPLSGMVGFHPDFCLEQFSRDTGLEIDEQVPVNAFGYWTLLRVSNRKPVPVDECATCVACAVPMAGLSG
jgi:phosphatidylethanolamine/phosphatidyl-N-methylethanolamine N-methyltransferase